MRDCPSRGRWRTTAHPPSHRHRNLRRWSDPSRVGDPDLAGRRPEGVEERLTALDDHVGVVKADVSAMTDAAADPASLDAFKNSFVGEVRCHRSEVGVFVCGHV